METSGHVDWLSVTLPETFDFQDMFWENKLWHQAPHGWLGFSKRYFSQAGTILLEGSRKNNDQHVIMGSDSLANARAMGAKDRSILLFFLAKQGKPSRIDLALDIFSSALIPADFREAYVTQRCVTPARSGTEDVTLGEPGHTVYIGSRHSDRMLRIYDKRAETGIKDMDAWLRLELQLRNLRARSAARQIANSQNEREVINGHVKNFYLWDNPDYELALRGARLEVDELPRKLPRLLTWAMEQVAPAFARYEVENPGVDMLALVRRWMDDWIDKKLETGSPEVDWVANAIAVSAAAVTDND